MPPLYPSRYPRFEIFTDASNYLGSFGEIVIDLSLPGLRIMDGCCCGGMLQIKAELTDCMKGKELQAQAEQAASQISEVLAPIPTKTETAVIGTKK